MIVKIAVLLIFIQNLLNYTLFKYGSEYDLLRYLVLSLDLLGFSVLAIGFYLHSRGLALGIPIRTGLMARGFALVGTAVGAIQRKTRVRFRRVWNGVFLDYYFDADQWICVP